VTRKIDLTDEPYFGIVLRRLRHWRDMHPWSLSLAANSPTPSTLMELTANIVAAYVKTNSLPVSSLLPLIEAVHKMILQLADNQPETPTLKPAVAIRKSIFPDYVICLEDGKKLKMLKRYLRTRYNLSPEDYRARWGLPADYPMVAPNYAARRSEFAKRIGLGRRPGRGKRRKNG
jgi:predicted transcriptional regulator